MAKRSKRWCEKEQCKERGVAWKGGENKKMEWGGGLERECGALCLSLRKLCLQFNR